MAQPTVPPPTIAELQTSAAPASNATASPATPHPDSKIDAAANGSADEPHQDVSSPPTTPTNATPGSELYSVEISPVRAVAAAPLITGVSAAGAQPKESLPISEKPLRVLNPEARRVGSLPRHDLFPSSSLVPQAAKLIAAQFEMPANSPAAVVLDSTKDAQGPHALPKGKTLLSDPTAQVASPALDSPATSRAIDTQPDSPQTTSPVAVVPPLTSQSLGNEAPATRLGDTPGARPTPVSGDGDAGYSGSVQTARVVQGVTQSEMHIGFRTPAFGSVEVHTAVRDAQLGLAVSSERGDLRGFLAQEVPGLQTVFHQQGLQFDQIRFVAPGSGAGSSFSAGSNSHSDSPGDDRSTRSWYSQNPKEEPEAATSEIQPRSARLSVHV